VDCRSTGAGLPRSKGEPKARAPLQGHPPTFCFAVVSRFGPSFAFPSIHHMQQPSGPSIVVPRSKLSLFVESTAVFTFPNPVFCDTVLFPRPNNRTPLFNGLHEPFFRPEGRFIASPCPCLLSFFLSYVQATFFPLKKRSTRFRSGFSSFFPYALLFLVQQVVRRASQPGGG